MKLFLTILITGILFPLMVALSIGGGVGEIVTRVLSLDKASLRRTLVRSEQH